MNDLYRLRNYGARLVSSLTPIKKASSQGVLLEHGISTHGWVVMRRMSYKLFEAGVQLTVQPTRRLPVCRSVADSVSNSLNQALTCLEAGAKDLSSGGGSGSTRRDFEPLGIEKGDPSAGITNQPLHLQRAGCQTDAAARNTEYLRHHLVSEIESSIARPVARE